MDLDAAVEHAVAELEPRGRLVDVRTLTGGVSADVLRLDIITSDGHGRRVVFRRHRADGFKQHGRSIIAKEHAVLLALHQGGFAVPEPYLRSDSDAEGGPYMIIEWIEGSTDIEADELPIALEQMAHFLFELHSLDLRSTQLRVLDHVEDPLKAMVVYLPHTEAGECVRAMLARGALMLERSRPVLLHGDYWPGNVMWHQAELVAVIDWEDACLGDPLADLATARVELLCQFGADAMNQFTDRYLVMVGDSIGPFRRDSLLIWELYVSAAALSTMSGWGLEAAEEARRRHLTEAFFEHAAHQLEATQ